MEATDPHVDEEARALRVIGSADAPLGVYRGIVESSVHAFVVVDGSGTVTFANRGLVFVSGYEPEAIVGHNIAEYVHPDDLAVAIQAFAEVGTEWGTRAGEGVPLLVRTREIDGGWREVEIGAQNRLDDPDVNGVILRIRPAGGEPGFARSLEHLVADRPIEDVFSQLCGALLAALPGSRTAAVAYGWNGSNFESTTLVGPDHDIVTAITRPEGPVVRSARSAIFATIDAAELERGDSPNGPSPVEAVWVQPVTRLAQTACVIVTREFPGPPWTTHEVVLQRSLDFIALVLERRDKDRRLLRAARNDSLTGLSNRAVFFEALAACLDDPMHGASAVLCIDLDGFKPVNDSFGHSAGDQVLRVVAERLTEICRPDDIVSRLGGDEFAVLCRSVSSPESAQLIGQRFLEAMRAPFHGLHQVEIGASVGTLFVPAADSSDACDRILEAADNLMYDAKRAGGSVQRSATFDPG